MAVNIDSDYRYVRGSLQRIAGAWQDFQASLPQSGSPALSVNFVPAFHGCFVVVQRKRRSRPLRSLLFGEPAGNRHLQHLLDQFCLALASRA